MTLRSCLAVALLALGFGLLGCSQNPDAPSAPSDAAAVSTPPPPPTGTTPSKAAERKGTSTVPGPSQL